jgi:hypothetical protein
MSGNQYHGREAKKFDMVRVLMHFPGSTVDHVRVIDQNMQFVAVITVLLLFLFVIRGQCS